MKVYELIEILQQYDGNTPVHFSYNSGDYWNTTLFPEISDVDISNINNDDGGDEIKAVIIS